MPGCINKDSLIHSKIRGGALTGKANLVHTSQTQPVKVTACNAVQFLKSAQHVEKRLPVQARRATGAKNADNRYRHIA
jgi:hypothetical protein